jgi:stalled ribosome rescue protein Dom34
MKNVGIWIDKKEAKIVTIEAGNERLDTIESDAEDFNPVGGSGTRLKGGPQDVVQDSKYLEREKHQLAEFFKEIAIKIADSDAIVILGPAQTGGKLYKELLEKYSQFNEETISVEKTDNMTDNQIMAWVRDYYSSDN